MLAVVVSLVLGGIPLSSQGPFVETDAGVKDWGMVQHPPTPKFIAGDTLLSVAAGFWLCISEGQTSDTQLAFTGPGGVRFMLASNVNPGGTNWLVATHNRALRSLRVDCSVAPQPFDVPGTTDAFAPFESIAVATTERSGQVVASTNERVIRFDPVQGGITVLHTIADLKPQLLTAEELDTQAIRTLTVVDLLATPHDDLWMLLQWQSPTAVIGVFLVHRDPSGALTTVLKDMNSVTRPLSTGFLPQGPHSTLDDTVLYEPRRDLIVLKGRVLYPAEDARGVLLPSLVAFPAVGPRSFTRVVTTVMPEILPSTGAGLFVNPGALAGFGAPGSFQGVRLEFGPLRFDGDTDLDGDGLSFSRERAAGTDDLRLDSDGDLVWDHLELTRFGTDPADAGSAPARTDTSVTGFAFSTRLEEWREFANPGAPFGGLHVDHSPGRAFCRGVEPTDCNVLGCAGFKRYDCFGPTGAPVHSAPLKRFPSFAPGLTQWWLGDDTGLELADAVSAQRVVSVDECNARRCGQVSAVAPGVAYGPGRLESSGLELRRYTTAGSTNVCVPEGCGPFLVGQFEATGEVFVSKRVGHRDRVYSVAVDGGTTFVLDSAFFRSPTVDSLWATQRGAVLAMGGSGAKQLVTLDEALVPVGTSTVPLDVSQPWFRSGFGRKSQLGYVHAPYTGGSGSSSCPSWAPAAVCTPPPQARRLPYPVIVDLYGELLPVDSRLRPGDVVFWVNSLQTAPNGYAIEAGKSGGLWLHRESGATDQWLSPDTMLQLAEPAARVSLTATPRLVARQVTVSPSASRLCLTDFTGRLFTVTLTAGRASAVTLVQETGAFACAWTDDETLAVLEQDSLVIGSRRLPLGIIGDATGESLHRAGTGWVARFTRGSASQAQVVAQCFDAAGAPVGEVPHVSALTVEDGVVTWIERLDMLSGATRLPADQQGRGWAATVAEFCAGRRTETLSVKGPRQPDNLWAKVFAGIVTPDDGLQVLHGTLARRPDGLLLLSSRGIDSRERGGVDSVGKFLFEFPVRVLPAYHPFDGELAKHAGWRREKDRLGLIHHWPGNVTAMATVPGVVAADYGAASRAECLGRACTPYQLAPVVPDAGEVDDAGVEADGGIEPSAPTPACGCSSASPGALLLAFAVLAWLGARRARSGRELKRTGRPSQG